MSHLVKTLPQEVSDAPIWPQASAFTSSHGRGAGVEQPFCYRGAHRTLTGVLGQPGSDADLQHFVAGLEDGQVTEALVELHLPGASCAPGTPVLLLQLQFKTVISTFVGTNQSELTSEKMVLIDPAWTSVVGKACYKNAARPDNLNQVRDGHSTQDIAQIQVTTELGAEALGPAPVRNQLAREVLYKYDNVTLSDSLKSYCLGDKSKVTISRPHLLCCIILLLAVFPGSTFMQD